MAYRHACKLAKTGQPGKKPERTESVAALRKPRAAAGERELD